MLKIQKLTASYGGPDIIHELDIEVGEGEVVTIVGPNGAGKSTVLRSIFGLTKVSDGEIDFFGEDLVGLRTDHVIERGICYVPQGRTVFASMTVEENLEMGAYVRSDKGEIRRDLEYVYEKFPKLYERKLQKCKTLSGGEQQMVAIGRALMLQPRLLLLDEPSIGLAPKIIEEVFDKCMNIKEAGTSILMVEQNAVMALEYSDRGYVLELGRNRYEGGAAELLADKKMGELYLGK